MNTVKRHREIQYWLMVAGGLLLVWIVSGLAGCQQYPAWDQTYERTYEK